MSVENRGRFFVTCPACRIGRIVERRLEDRSVMTEVAYSRREIDTSVYREPTHRRFIACSSCPVTWPDLDALTAAWLAAGRPTRH